MAGLPPQVEESNARSAKTATPLDYDVEKSDELPASTFAAAISRLLPALLPFAFAFFFAFSFAFALARGG